ncbi:MAG TPA: hypothetical protein VNJ08_06155 [Bacteriovoracaceae bacterium]|nr:hypothetical protein [Bacteriovoracaceae bacterium]
MVTKLFSVLVLLSAMTAEAALSPYAGKISLWKRQGTTSPTDAYYDNAVFLPADYDPSTTKSYPMIITLHGLGGSVLNTAHTAVGGYRSGFINQVWGTALAQTYKAIVIAPNRSPAGTTIRALWSHAQLRQLIIDAKKKYKIDPARIVATGFSAGSIATQQLVRYSKDLIAGAMPGAYDNNVLAYYPCTAASIPMWVFGNNSDTLFKSARWREFRPKVEACSNYIHEFKLTVYDNTCGHGCWDRHWARSDVQQWLMNQSK